MGGESESVRPVPTDAAGAAEATALWHRCRQFIEACPVPMAAVEGPEHRVRSVNPAFCRLIGAARETLLGRPFAAAVPQWAGSQALLDRVSRTGKAAALVEQARAAPAAGVWACTAWPVRELGEQPVGVMLLVPETPEAEQFGRQLIAMNQALQDRETARVQAEEDLRASEKRYRSLFEHMLNGVAYCRMVFEPDRPPDFLYLGVNRAFETLTGLQAVVGKRVSEVIPGLRLTDPGLFEIYGRVARTGVPERFERYIEALGMWCAVAVYSPRPDHFVAVFDVITERKRAEEAMQQTKDDLDRRVHERTAALSTALQLVAAQSEQLRSLASELTLVEQRERSHLAEQIHDGLQQLLVAAKLRVTSLGRAADLAVREGCQDVVHLLDDAVADARSLTAELSPPVLRTGGLLAGLAWLARWCQEKHHLTVHVQAPALALPSLPEDLTVLLFQSVREILFNAVKYAGVSEAAVVLARQADGLTLTVADAGVGFQPDSLRGEGGAGGGFGLARIRHRLELLGGCMHIASAPGQGSRVTLAILLPTADQPPALPLHPLPRAAVPAEVAPGLGGSGKIRVLVVDDHQVVRQAFAQLLRTEADLEVVGEAGTGTAAVVLAHQLAPDVVLMDINMPEMNGIEATRALHIAFPALRVIGLSVYERGDQETAMHDAGAVAYLSKSGPAEALLAAIRGGG